MISFDDVIKGNIKQYNLNWQEISGYPYKILITGRSRSEKKNAEDAIYMLNIHKKQNVMF